MIAPERSLDQRRTALVRANDVRAKRAQLRRDLKAGRVSAAKLIADPPEWLETMKLINFLLALPKVGRVKASKYLNKCQVAPSKTIGGLSPRQREELRIVLS